VAGLRDNRGPAIFNSAARAIYGETMPQVIESMTRIIKHPWVIRVWRTEESLQEHYDNSDIILMLDEQYADYPTKIAQAVLEMPRVSAVEVVDRIKGDGVVVYKDWP
jgi:hypothetical protein